MNMVEPMSLKRPKPGDGEEELFRMQEEFLRSNEVPSAKVINLRMRSKNQMKTPTLTGESAPAITKSLDRVRSKFAESKRHKGQQLELDAMQAEVETVNATVSGTVVHGDIVERSFDAVQNVPVARSSVVLGNIVERKFDGKKFDFKPIGKSSLDTLQNGFPGVFISEDKESDGSQSLFWQRKSKQEPIMVDAVENSVTIPSNEGNSILVDGPWASEIHRANIQTLREMSKEEILSEKTKLQATLDPGLIEFIKTRKKKKEQDKDVGSTDQCRMDVKLENPDISKGNEKPANKMEVDSGMEKDKRTSMPPVEILEEAKQKGWVHMDALEPEKLEWMEEMGTAMDNDPSPDEPYNARFDFNGTLLPFKDESLTTDKGLHHHGEEPDRPGYSLQELLQLSRSSTQQQRCTALTTLANIMEKSRMGWYDKALHPAPLPALNQRNILLLLRFSLDDTSVAVVTATLQALRALLFSEADEVCLDRLMGLGDYREPSLTVPPIDVKDMINLKDHELAQLDTVATALRTDIVIRIRYILNEMQPPPIGVTAALEILVRLARHSNGAAINIARTIHLHDTIMKHFIPLSTERLVTEDTMNSMYGVPVVAAVRLFRVLVCYGGSVVAERLFSLKMIHSILSYVSSDAGKQGVHLSIESLRLWKILLLHGYGLESVGGAQLTLVSQLRLLHCNHDIGASSELACEHAAMLVAVAGCESSLRQYISPLLSKWSTQLATVSSPSWASTKLLALTLTAVGDISLMKPLWKENATNVFSSLCSSSNVLSDLTPATERDPSSLPNLGVLTHDGQLQPAVSQNSCIPFLATVIDVLSKSLCKAEIQCIFNEPRLNRYIEKLVSFEWSLERSWYTRMELSLITAIVRAGTLLGNDLNVETRQTIWKLALKLVSALPADAPLCVREMLRTVLSIDKLKIDLLLNDLNKLKLKESDENIELDLPDNLASLYADYIVQNGTWDQAAMPKDWLYLPLVHLYAKCRNNYECSEDDGRIASILLSLELVFPELVQTLSPSLRYSRLLLVYLCDTLFLDKNVSSLLTKAFGNLLQNHYKRFDFTVELPGLSSFTDLFTALCEHFSATSYGDHGFGMALLAPLAQRHDAHYRKLLWSEHAGALRSLRTPLEKLRIPLKEYLYPLEEDESLIESYLGALARGNVRREWCPVLYTVALHHAAMYIKKESKLAIRFRTRIEKLGDLTLKEKLLNYVPPEF